MLKSQWTSGEATTVFMLPTSTSFFLSNYRKALLDVPTVATLKQVTDELAERYEVEIERLGADRDHVHLLVSLHPKYSVGQFVRLYKSITARQLFQHHPALKKDPWGGELWSDSYYVTTVGERGNWGVVEQCITNQGLKPEDVQLRFL